MSTGGMQWELLSVNKVGYLLSHDGQFRKQSHPLAFHCSVKLRLNLSRFDMQKLLKGAELELVNDRNDTIGTRYNAYHFKLNILIQLLQSMTYLLVDPCDFGVGDTKHDRRLFEYDRAGE